MQKDKYYRPYIYNDGKYEYLHMGPNDIGKSSIPKAERCEGFNELWAQVFADVMKYWNFVPVEDIHEFDQYNNVEE